ncbi:ExbD/TolR family protein [Betaproteobacteria bacterium PRO7]|nr:ExbD/TolR family protein [Burkholderiaceae bacterium]MDL1863162.1 ExbD/TolR family protein [Betaproteobacteria bacterium PRO7]GIL06502.1 MAG: TolR-like protein [Betaproteobacteria bacterium]
MALLARRQSGSRRRMLADINVVPYIDVMLVLVVILMVAAPFVNPSLVNLPTVGKSSRAPDRPLEIVIRADGRLTLREVGKELANDLPGAVAAIKKRQQARKDQPPPVVIAADKDVRYDHVMKVMDALQKEGVARVGLSVKPPTP